jgi:putative tricarboxylic transport membrane protein
MDAFSLLATGLATVLQPGHFMMIVIGLAIGVVAGALPGISFVNAMAMALPFTYMMSPLDSMSFLGGIYAGGVFGGSISAILINIPGTPASLPACWDGYPMTKQGKSGRALTIAIAASATGGVVSALLLTFGAPPFAKFALQFDQPEFFAATFLGLVSIIAVAKSAPWISFLSLFIGLAIGTVGVDPLYGVPRLTFGATNAQSGINFVVVMIGLFALGEVVEMLAKSEAATKVMGKIRFERPKFSEMWALRWSVMRGTAIGSVIGMIPGAGATVERSSPMASRSRRRREAPSSVPACRMV